MGLGVEGESCGEASCYKVGDEGKRGMEIDGEVYDCFRPRRHEMACLGAEEVEGASYQLWRIFQANFQ